MVHDEPDLREYVLLGIILFHLGVGAHAVLLGKGTGNLMPPSWRPRLDRSRLASPGQQIP
jgi:hypothetical protein